MKNSHFCVIWVGDSSSARRLEIGKETAANNMMMEGEVLFGRREDQEGGAVEEKKENVAEKEEGGEKEEGEMKEEGGVNEEEVSP